MERITEKAYAKVNLSLYITGRRQDGYHLLSSVMQTVDLYDEITVCRVKENSGPDFPIIEIETDSGSIPTDKGNTVYVACEEFFKRADIPFESPFRIKVFIKKKIPICAGLGGPSADAAAALKALNRLFFDRFSIGELKEIGLKVGADVPFLIEGGLGRCEGIGEIIHPIEAVCPGYILLAKPNVSVSTAWAYGSFDEACDFTEGDGGSLEAALLAGDLSEISKNLYNDFSEVVFDKYPVIRALRDLMLKLGASGALMSGSGSTVFGLFDSKEKLDFCKNSIEESFSDTELIATKGIKL